MFALQRVGHFSWQLKGADHSTAGFVAFRIFTLQLSKPILPIIQHQKVLAEHPRVTDKTECIYSRPESTDIENETAG